ncbi:hypothetical protein BDV96DRAFT_331877 [Lophiotrema nucula]|uniref:Uncharacterized protein n=1 Tax=Lophiotrema nucula TaxID=690887 RepID=A0A6A5YGR3_9PLEO|nr:hypothetical protein BDV96DRAFT_331877 [Lophiotrema nucula]
MRLACFQSVSAWNSRAAPIDLYSPFSFLSSAGESLSVTPQLPQAVASATSFLFSFRDQAVLQPDNFTCHDNPSGASLTTFAIRRGPEILSATDDWSRPLVWRLQYPYPTDLISDPGLCSIRRFHLHCTQNYFEDSSHPSLHLIPLSICPFPNRTCFSPHLLLVISLILLSNHNDKSSPHARSATRQMEK